MGSYGSGFLPIHNETPMNILLLGPIPPPWGGVQTNLMGIRSVARAHGYTVKAINLTRFRRPDDDGLLYPTSARAVLGLLFSVPAQIVHLHIGGDIPLRLILLALACTLVPGRRAVFTLHSGGYPSSPAGRQARPASLRGFVFRRFARIIAVNQEIRDLFVYRFGCAPHRVAVIAPHTAPPPPAEPVPDALTAFLAGTGPFLISIGGLEPEYDIPLQFQIIGTLRASHPGIRLLICGGGSQHAALAATLAALPWRDHICLYGDMPRLLTLTLLARARLFLRTTLYDGDAISVREALHYGIPAVVSDNGMRPPGARLFPPGDTAACASAVLAELALVYTPKPTPPIEENNGEAILNLYREILLES